MQYKKFIGLTDDALKIREKVFVEEQGFKDEFDEIDKYAQTLVFYDEDTPVAVCRYFKGKEKDTYIIGRVAVIKEYRHKNIGRFVMSTAENEIKLLGAKKIHLSAQLQAQGFYKSCGYIQTGETYFEEHCEHIGMDKTLY